MPLDVAEWLCGLGLEQYAASFRDNDIDAAVLPELTAEDLTGLGVTSIGHRRKLLAAISGLRAAPPAAEPVPPRTDIAERRQLTVMFCDLVGSTALSARFDPEDLRDIVAGYHGAVERAVGRFEGFVAKYMGDGVLVYFGYPQAHEDDAERAVRAGLAAVAAVGGLRGRERLQVRIGIATGVAVVGDLIGAGAAQERGVVGETPNLAARLQGLAEPDAIVIGKRTRQLIGGLFELADLGAQRLAGFAEPQRAWRVLGESAIHSRFEALRSGDTPLVGRDEELALLLRRWQQAQGGEGRVVLLSGEAGIGKSRLTSALAEHIAAEPHLRLRFFCSPHHQDSALYPVAAQLQRAAGFARDDADPARLDKLRGALVASEQGGQDLALLAALLSVPMPGPPLDLTPQRQRAMTLDALLRQFGGLSRQRPVLAVFEDAHWIDPSSAELLDRMVADAAGLPALLLVTARPEFRPGWVGEAHVSVQNLNRLAGADGAALVRSLAGNAGLGAQVVDEIVERTDGVPLFVEELTRAIVESGAGESRVAAVLSGTPRTASAVPATLHASLLARLDRLGPAAKEIAQIGSVLGREFGHELIAAVAGGSEAELQPGLDRLGEAGLLLRRGSPPFAVYLFKHALVQDAAYGTLLRARRQELHGRVADALVAEPNSAAPEILAHHLQNAGREAEAIAHWREAGEAALRRAANREAIGHFRRALALVAREPDGNERRRVELAILSQLGPALMSVHGWSAPEVGEVVERAAELGRQLPSSAELAPAIANLWMFNVARGQLDRADEIGNDVRRIADELEDPDILLQAHHCGWALKFMTARYGEAEADLDAGAALYDEVRHAPHRHLYAGHDPGVCNLVFRSTVLGVLGQSAHAVQLAEEAIALARRLSHVPSLAVALWRAGQLYSVVGDAATAVPRLNEVLSLAEAHGLPQPRASATVHLGWALARSGQAAEGAALALDGLRLMDAMGSNLQRPEMLGWAAESLIAAGRWEEAWDLVARAHTCAAETGESWFVPRLYRIEATLLRRRAEGERAEAALRQALAVARRHGAVGWEIGAALDLARLWAGQGRGEPARALLAPVAGRFTDGAETDDLREAAVLLAELG